MLLLSIHLYRSKKILEDLAHLLMILQIQIYHLRCPWEVICPFQAPNHQDLLKNLTTEAVIPDQIVRAIQCYQHIQTNLPTITLEHKYLPVDNLLWIWEECNLQDMHRICQVIMAILIPLNQLQTILHIITSFWRLSRLSRLWSSTSCSSGNVHESFSSDEPADDGTL